MRDVWLSTSDCRLDDLVRITGTPTDPAAYPRASAIVDGVAVAFTRSVIVKSSQSA